MCGLSLFLACSGDGAESIIRSLLMDYIETEDKIELEPEDEGTTFSVDALKPWTISDIPEWLTIEPTSGYGKYEVHVSVKPNYTTDSRSAVLKVKSGEHQKEIRVSQRGGKLPEIRNLDVRDQNITTYGFQATFVASNVMACGICVSSNNSEPTTDDSTFTATLQASNTWVANANNLSSSTLYYIRAYAENQFGTVYSPTKAVQTNEHYLKVKHSTLNLKADGSIIQTEVECSEEWQISDQQGTIKLYIDPSRGRSGKTSINVWAEVNTVVQELKGSFTIKSEHSSTTVEVTQDAGEVPPSPDSEHFLIVGETEGFAPEGGNQQISVDTKDKWSVETDPNANWCKIEKSLDDKSLTISVTSNKRDDMSTDDRIARIKVKTDYVERTLNVQQKGRELILTVNPTQVDFSTTANASSQEVNVDATVAWKATSADPTWCSVQKNGNTSFMISVTANTSNSPRTTAVTVKMADKSVAIPVKQVGTHILTLNPSSFNFGYPASSGMVIVNSNGDKWEVTSAPSWCSVYPLSGTDGTIKITAQENTAEKERDALITIKTDYKTGTVNIEQAGKVNHDLTVTPTSLSFNENEDEQSITITSKDNWTVSSNQSWCVVTPNTNMKELKVKVSSNSSKSPRYATVIVKTDYKSVSIKVTQEGKKEDDHILILSDSILSVTSVAETKQVTITTKDDWRVSSNQTWCTIQPLSGTGNGTITISIAATTSTKERVATISVKTDYKTQKIGITQAGKSEDSDIPNEGDNSLPKYTRRKK